MVNWQKAAHTEDEREQASIRNLAEKVKHEEECEEEEAKAHVDMV